MQFGTSEIRKFTMLLSEVPEKGWLLEWISIFSAWIVRQFGRVADVLEAAVERFCQPQSRFELSCVSNRGDRRGCRGSCDRVGIRILTRTVLSSNSPGEMHKDRTSSYGSITRDNTGNSEGDGRSFVGFRMTTTTLLRTYRFRMPALGVGEPFGARGTGEVELGRALAVNFCAYVDTIHSV